MINKNNIRFCITLSKRQYTWLNNFSKSLNLTTSKVIAWMLSKKSKEIKDIILLTMKPNDAIEKLDQENINTKIEEESISDEELNNILNDLENLKK